MVNFSRIHSKADLIGSLNPKAWDAVNPHTPFVFSNAHVDLMVADAVKSVAVAITNKALSREVMDISKGMAKQASTALSASWEPGDELCPPWPWPFPHPRSWIENFGSEPVHYLGSLFSLPKWLNLRTSLFASLGKPQTKSLTLL